MPPGSRMAGSHVLEIANFADADFINNDNQRSPHEISGNCGHAFALRLTCIAFVEANTLFSRACGKRPARPFLLGADHFDLRFRDPQARIPRCGSTLLSLGELDVSRLCR